MTPRRVRLALAATIGAAVFVPMVTAVAYWTLDGTGDATARADVMQPGHAPVATAVAHRVTVSWSPSALVANEWVAADRYDVYRYTTDVDGVVAPESRTLAEDCAIVASAVTCTIDDLDAGTYRFGVVPRFAGWSGAEGERSAPVTVARPDLAPATRVVNLADPELRGLVLSGFRDGEPVDLLLERELDGVSMLLATVTTDERGALAVPPLEVPETTEGGVHVLRAIGARSGATDATASILVDRVAPFAIAPTVPTWSTDDVRVSFVGLDAPPGRVVAFRVRVGDGAEQTLPSEDASVVVTSTAPVTFTATDDAGNVSAPEAVVVRIDRTAPEAGPNTTPARINRSVVLSNVPADSDSGVADVQFLWCPTNGCDQLIEVAPPDTTAPFSTTWSVQPADGAYRLVVRVTDVAGNVATSEPFDVVVDNTGPALAIDALPSVIGASVPLGATATDGSGVTSVTFEYATSPSGPWKPAGAAAKGPDNRFTFTWSTIGLDATSYAVRATATDGLGNSSSPARTASTTLYGPTSVTLVNRPLGAAGRLETGDTIVITWNRPPNANALCGKWSQFALPTPLNGVTIKVVDVPGRNDRLDILVACNNGSNGNFGSIDLGGDYTDAVGAQFGGSGSGNANGLVTYNPLANTMTFTLGTATGTRKTVAQPGPATYVPAPGAVFGDIVPASRPKTTTNF